ncbi:MAG: hypothetical protein IIA27_15110 [Gemmatimonadetes bacterium]|nr:hypothetical protein [Gemmatimonadota bacterium]
MILGLTWTAWLLLTIAVGTGLAIELVFYSRHRGRADRPGTTDPNPHPHRHP